MFQAEHQMDIGLSIAILAAGETIVLYIAVVLYTSSKIQARKSVFGA
jgi:hypothetical protein